MPARPPKWRCALKDRLYLCAPRRILDGIVKNVYVNNVRKACRVDAGSSWRKSAEEKDAADTTDTVTEFWRSKPFYLDPLVGETIIC